MNHAVLGAVSGLGFLLRIGFEIALIAVALTTVRASRPDASSLLAGAGGAQLFNSVTGYALSIAMPHMAGGGSEGILVGVLAQQGLSMAISTVAYVLLLLGIVRLARPAQTGAVDPGRYT